MDTNLNELSKKELQDLCTAQNIEFLSKDTKADLITKLGGTVEDETDADFDDAEFNMDAYKVVSFLTIDAKRRKKETLSPAEQLKLDEFKPLAYKNKGLKPLKTNTYRVQMQTVYLIEGLPTPQSIVTLFTKEAQKKLFV